MQVKVQMPRMGQSMDEGSIVKWLINEGDIVKKDDPLAEIETDKAVITLESLTDGKVEKLIVSIGEIVPVGQPVAIIEDGKPDKNITGIKAKVSPIEDSSKPDLTINTISELDKKPTEKPLTKRINASPAAKAYAQSIGIDLSEIPVTDSRGFITKSNIEDFINSKEFEQENDLKPSRVNSSPVAKRLADELGLDMRRMTGTGEGDRITKEDVNEFHNKLNQDQAPRYSTDNEPIIVPLSKVKRKTAERMTESKDTIPHFYVSIDFDISHALALRESLNNRGEDISINDLIIRGTVITLKKYPNLNAIFSDDKIHQYPHVDIAIAVSHENSLITPVIRNCEQLSLIELSQATKALIVRTRSGALTAEDLETGTFTISNLGMYGINEFAAIINPPQVAILAVGTVQKLPMFDDFNNVIASQRIKVTLSADHRVVDGVEVSKFLRELKNIMEDGFQLGEIN